MRIALLISGRCTRYDACLLPLLKENSHIEIDIFMSVNDENEQCEYYNTMKTKLSHWLKSCIIKKYVIPEETARLFDPNENICNSLSNINLQSINGKNLPNNCLSMYYNDSFNFKAACEYADKNMFEYDYFMKYRSDIINLTLPTDRDVITTHLCCAIPACNFTSNGLFKKPIVNDAFAWGNRKIMEVYCNTYDYAINKNNEYKGKYYIAFECTLTDNIYEKNINVSYYNFQYSLDKNRRMFDDVNADTRSVIPNQQYLLKITDSESLNFIEQSKQE